MAIRDDLLPVQNAPANGARLQVTDQLSGTPVTVNGPLIEVNSALNQLQVGGVELGDTGWRDITGSLSVTPTAGSVLVRRQGQTVTIQIAFVRWPTVPPIAFWTPPVGFRASGLSRGYYSYDMRFPASSPSNVFYVWRYTTAWYCDPAADGGTPSETHTHACTIEYYTPDVWPSALPGI